MYDASAAGAPRDTTVGTNVSLNAETWPNRSSYGSAPSMHGARSMRSTTATPSMLQDRTDVSSCYGAPSTMNRADSFPSPMVGAAHQHHPIVQSNNGCEHTGYFQHALAQQYSLYCYSPQRVWQHFPSSMHVIVLFCQCISLVTHACAEHFCNDPQSTTAST